MAKVKIQGNASGTGVLTVTAPNTSTDRTITLPDSTGELLSTAGGTMTGDLTIGSVGSVTSSGSDLKISGTDDIFFNVAGASDNILQLYGNNSTNVNTQTKVASPFYPFADNSYDLGNSTERWKDLYLSGGLKVGGTGSANTLDDYEEGIHQTTFAAGNGQSITTGRNDLGYTKIGNLVSITGEITCNAASSPTGGTTITLPFVIATNAGDREFNFGSAPLCYHVNEYEDRMPMILGGSGASTVTLLYQRHDASFYDFNVAASDTFFFSFSYKTN